VFQGGEGKNEDILFCGWGWVHSLGVEEREDQVKVHWEKSHLPVTVKVLKNEIL
jgi:hypothetical protein